ncbi:MAG: metal ABC transporter substrate-binding protein [Desulfobulbaceae bacterium]|nr:metal ABC transporter substrate-binding protein [Desulfobulbaceae bacterium]
MGCFVTIFLAPLAIANFGEKPLRILCTTFPLYQITRNLTKGRDVVRVDLLLPARLGCPHDYALTPSDMQLLAQADVLVVNGLGLEEFLGAPIKKANPAIRIIDSSNAVTDLLYGDAEEKRQHGGSGLQVANPHLFVSPRLAGQLGRYLAARFTEVDPGGKEIYASNSQAYSGKMAALDQKMVALGKSLKNKRIITQHGVFDYLARDLGLEVVAVVEAHAGQEPSAAEMLALVKTAKAEHVGAFFSEPQYPARVVATIAQEAGIASATLDPVATGPDDAGLDYYEKVMLGNMQVLKSTLGTD